MAVFRINKTKDYTVISNYHLRDKNLSLKAKGLLSVMLSLPDSWDYSIEGLVLISKESRTSIKSTLDELKENNYLVVTKQYPNETQDGRIGYIYDIFEERQNAHKDSDTNENKENKEKKQEGKKQGIENLGVENLGIEIQGIENVSQLNTNILNTKELNTKKINTKKTIYKPHPDFQEVEAYIKEKHLNVKAKDFFDYFEAGNWCDSKGNKVKNWKQKLLTWNKFNKNTSSNRETYIPTDEPKEMWLGTEEELYAYMEKQKEK